MKQRKIAFLTSLGVALEYYDFVIYIILAHYLSQLFFPPGNETIALLETLAVFALGYLARPLGGIIFGSIGDRHGRRNTFSITMVLMAAATLAIGLLPTYESIGIMATVSLILLRIIQGIALGAEVPGAVTFLTEHANQKKRGFYCGLMFLGLSVGGTLANFVNYVLTSLYTDGEMLAWAWRVPFILGSLLAIVSYYIRRHTHETPHFQQQVTHTKTPFKELIANHPVKLIQGLIITLAPASFVLFALYIPTYLITYFNYETSDIYLVNTVGILAAMLLVPFFGWLSDYIGRRRQLMLAGIIIAIAIHGVFLLLFIEQVAVLYIFIILYQIAIASLVTCYPPILAELFPTKVRYSGIALSYNVAFSTASFMPLLASGLLSMTGKPMAASGLLAVIAIITVISAYTLQDRTGEKLTD